METKIPRDLKKAQADSSPFVRNRHKASYAVFEKHGNGKSATGGVVADNAGGKLILAAPRNSRRMGDYVLLL